MSQVLMTILMMEQRILRSASNSKTVCPSWSAKKLSIFINNSDMCPIDICIFF